MLERRKKEVHWDLELKMAVGTPTRAWDRGMGLGMESIWRGDIESPEGIPWGIARFLAHNSK